MANANEYTVETFVIAILSANAALAAIPPKHHDEDDQSSAFRLTVSATQGVHIDAAPGRHEYAVEIRAESNDPDAERLAAVSAAVNSTIPIMRGEDTSADKSAFSYFRIEDDIEADRPVDPDTRSRVITYPIIAQLV